jgi:hypothetical protein
MDAELQILADKNELDAIIEKHSLALLKILGRPHTIDELAAEIAVLADLMHSFKRMDNMIEQLLDGGLSKDKRCEIQAALEAQHVKVAVDHEEMVRLHEKSRMIIERSSAVLAKAQLQVNKEAHNYSGYALEICGLCQGLGDGSVAPCPACKGRGSVPVRQPAVRCSRCGGNGKTSSRDKAIHFSALCVTCNGTGWDKAKKG